MLIRPLLPTERGAFRAHMHRLDAETRRLRFFHPVNDSWVASYLDDYPWERSLILLAFVDGLLCGSAEVIADAKRPTEAEFAIAVEAGYRRRGIGKELLTAALLRARNRGIRQLTVASLPENAALRALLAPHQPTSHFEFGFAEARLTLEPPDLAAMIEDSRLEGAAMLHHQALALFEGMADAADCGRTIRQHWALLLEDAHPA